MVLYVSRFCGACYRVLATVEQLGLRHAEIEVRDVTRYPKLRQEIVYATGRRTVPVLRISPGSQPDEPAGADEWMFESRDIVRYLRTIFHDQ